MIDLNRAKKLKSIIHCINVGNLHRLVSPRCAYSSLEVRVPDRESDILVEWLCMSVWKDAG